MFNLDDTLNSEAHKDLEPLTSMGQLYHLEIPYTLSHRPK